MSNTAVEDFLAHKGIKGMKWGQKQIGNELTPEEKTAMGLAPLDATTGLPYTIDGPLADRMREESMAKLHPNAMQVVQGFIQGLFGHPNQPDLGKVVQAVTADVSARVGRFLNTVFPKVVTTTTSRQRPYDNKTTDVNVQTSENGRPTGNRDYIKVRHSDFSDAGTSLAHFGRLGMKWGVRRDTSSGAGTTKFELDDGTPSKGSYSRSSSRDHILSREIGMKKAHEMSNTELSAFTKRLGLEKQYSELVAQKSQIEKGHTFVKKMLGLGKTAVEIHKLYNSDLGKAVKVAALAASVSKGAYQPKRVATTP